MEREGSEQGEPLAAATAVSDVQGSGALHPLEARSLRAASRAELQRGRTCAGGQCTRWCRRACGCCRCDVDRGDKRHIPNRAQIQRREFAGLQRDRTGSQRRPPAINTTTAATSRSRITAIRSWPWRGNSGSTLTVATFAAPSFRTVATISCLSSVMRVESGLGGYIAFRQMRARSRPGKWSYWPPTRSIIGFSGSPGLEISHVPILSSLGRLTSITLWFRT